MPVQIVPVIATSQMLYDYMGITGAQAAANLINGTTTLAVWIARLRDATATSIVQLLNYDFTTVQVQNWNGYGNDLSILEFDFPINAFTNFKSWDPLNPTTAVVDEGTGNLTVLSIDPTIIFRNDKKTFASWLYYYLSFTQIADPINPSGWPLDIITVQCEMVALTMRQSNNGIASIGKAEFEGLAGRPLKYQDMMPFWKQRLNPYKKIAI